MSLTITHTTAGRKLTQAEYEADNAHEVSGCWEKIADVEVDTDCDYVDITGLDGDVDKVYHIIAHLKNAGTGGDALLIKPNAANITTKYLYHDLYWNGSALSVLTAHGTVNYGFDLGYAHAGNWEQFVGTLLTKTGALRSCVSQDMRENDAGNDTEIIENRATSWYDTTTKITSLRVLHGDWSTGETRVNGIGAGSKILIFKSI